MTDLAPEPTPPQENGIHLPETDAHPCPALRRDIANRQRDAVPVEKRDPDDPDQWSRRVIKMIGFDFTGDHKTRKFSGSSLVSLQAEVIEKLKELANVISHRLCGDSDQISTADIMDMAVRWFIQHPPSYDWMEAYHAKWMMDHPRGGRRRSMSSDVPMDWDDVSKAGFESPEEFYKFLEGQKLKKRREMRIIMEKRDLTRDEICPGIEPGSLKNQKKVTRISGKVPEDLVQHPLDRPRSPSKFSSSPHATRPFNDHRPT